jgi:hypothetical protein
VREPVGALDAILAWVRSVFKLVEGGCWVGSKFRLLSMRSRHDASALPECLCTVQYLHNKSNSRFTGVLEE